ncbi:MAG: hypothetical protein OJI67_22490, partial [Prosthecobacter sp.]|nr:hypothetical protein [Prosthecobacter sp.]
PTALGIGMKITQDRYAGHTEEEDGFFQSPGSDYGYSEAQREYKFNIEDSMVEYATSLPSSVDGRVVTLMIHQPRGEGSSAIRIPRDCPVFLGALNHLKSIGIKHISFFNQVSGGFSQLAIEELADA